MSRIMAEEAKLYFQREAALAQAREDARFSRQDARTLMARVAEAFPGEPAPVCEAAPVTADLRAAQARRA